MHLFNTLLVIIFHSINDHKLGLCRYCNVFLYLINKLMGVCIQCYFPFIFKYQQSVNEPYHQPISMHFVKTSCYSHIFLGSETSTLGDNPIACLMHNGHICTTRIKTISRLQSILNDTTYCTSKIHILLGHFITSLSDLWTCLPLSIFV